MRTAADGDGSPEGKRAAITEAFRSADQYVRRFELSLLAPADVVGDAVTVFRRVQEIRDLLIGGAGAETAEYRAAQRAYYDATKAMSNNAKGPGQFPARCGNNGRAANLGGRIGILMRLSTYGPTQSSSPG